MANTNKYFIAVYDYFDFQSSESFLISIGITSIVIFNTSQILRALSFFIQNKFFLNVESELSQQLFEKISHLHYETLVENHSSDLIKNILAESSTLSHEGLMSFLTLISQGLSVIFILTLLLTVDFYISLTVGGVFLVFFLLLFVSLKKNLTIFGHELVEYSRKRFKILSETFSSIKEIKFRNLEKYFVNSFELASENYALVMLKRNLVAQLPRYGLEAMGVSLIMLIAIASISRSTSTQIVPLLALYAIAGYRLLPAVQQVYNAAVNLQSIGASLNSIKSVFYKISKEKTENIKFLHRKNSFVEECVRKQAPCLEASDIKFRYSQNTKDTLNGISIEIEPGSFVAIVGESGSGKTTLIDVILGLLVPQKGTIKLTAGDKLQRLESPRVGYVPQNICLLDGTIADNIVFDGGRVDTKKIDKVLRQTKLSKFINQLPDGIDTQVGEQGGRLSGGQRQRLGIARALYTSPQILVLDEPTNALDRLTEMKIIKTLLDLKGTVSTILVTHNLEIIKEADLVYIMEGGKINERGTFKELSRNSALFKSFLSN